MTTYYTKVGRRYKPTLETWPEAFPEGFTLVYSEPGSSCKTYGVTPFYARVLTALRAGERDFLKVIVDAMAARPNQRLQTPREQRAMKAYCEIMGKDAALTLTIPCAQDAFAALVNAVEDALMKYEGGSESTGTGPGSHSTSSKP